LNLFDTSQPFSFCWKSAPTRFEERPRPSPRSYVSVLPGPASTVKLRISLLIRVPRSGSKPENEEIVWPLFDEISGTPV
jgi:hypothetical protein